MFPRAMHPGAPKSERTVWTALNKLPDPWRIFHQLEWEGDRSGRPGDGEADFVLLHPEVGLIVIEVKGGDIAIGGGVWYSFDHRGQRHEIHDPFAQAKTSKHTLLTHAKDEIRNLSYLPVGHAVAFPDLRTSESLGVNAPADLMISGKDLDDPEAVVGRIAEHWEMECNLTRVQFDAITDVLAPTKELRRTVSDDVQVAAALVDAWTKEQLGALDALGRNDRQLVYGGAGTGKTVLAQEKAERLAAEGKRVLLTCFNQPLARRLQQNLKDVQGVTVSTFHALCRRLNSQAMRTLRPSGSSPRNPTPFPSNPTQKFWDEQAADLLVESADRIGFHVNALVVDEGQDFAPGWWDALELLLDRPSEGEFYMFADVHQAIYRPDWTPPFKGSTFELRRNCRNTLPIAKRVASVFDDEAQALGSEGLEPEFVESADKIETVEEVRKLLHRLIHDEKLRAEQVAVLCQRKDDVERLRATTLAGYRLGGMETWGSSVLAETIHRFKGLEADVCVVVIQETDRPWDRALAYIGMSRPRAQLYVIGPKAVRDSLGWT